MNPDILKTLTKKQILNIDFTTKEGMETLARIVVEKPWKHEMVSVGHSLWKCRWCDHETSSTVRLPNGPCTKPPGLTNHYRGLSDEKIRMILAWELRDEMAKQDMFARTKARFKVFCYERKLDYKNEKSDSGITCFWLNTATPIHWIRASILAAMKEMEE